MKPTQSCNPEHPSGGPCLHGGGLAKDNFLNMTVVVACLILSTQCLAVTIRSYDNARTGWYKQETILNPGNVNVSTFHKIGELRVDDKIEASPLFVPAVNTLSGIHDLLIVATTNNTVYAFDANSHEQVWSRFLGIPVQGLKAAVYDKWGITATPVIDPQTNILYVVSLGLENNQRDKVYRLHGVSLFNGQDAIQSQAVDGFSVKQGDKYFRNGEQYIRTALSLWQNPAGQKAIIFGAAGGESINSANGWIIAYNVAQLQAGGNVTPAVWCSTPNGGGGGIWMASQGLAIDENDANRDIYFATGNGLYQEQFFGEDDLGESVVRLRYDPDGNSLEAVDWFTPFTDATRDANHRDQDLGAGGVVLIPDSQSVLAGGKDGIFYNIKRNSMGKLEHSNLFQPALAGSFTPSPGFDFFANINQTTTTDGETGGGNGQRTFIPHPADNGRTRHIHGSPVYYANGSLRLVYIMGENSLLRAFRVSGNILTDKPVAFSGPTTRTSGDIPAPGGMAGGFLTVTSSNAAGADGIVWSVAPLKSYWRDPVASVIPVRSVLRAFNAVPSGTSISELWNSEMDAADMLGSASKWQPPLVVNGRVYVPTYNNKVVIYGLTPPRPAQRDIRRTMVLIKGKTQPGQDMFIRGGIDHGYGNSHGRNCPDSGNPAYDDPRYYHCAVWIEHRNTINYGSNHEPYPITNRWQVNDYYLDWYGREEFQSYQRLGSSNQGLGLAQGTPLDWTTDDSNNRHAVVRDGYGFLKENQDAGLGEHYWMLDVDMDCSTAVNVNGTFWFEVKSFITNMANGWEPDVHQADRPYVSGNHFAKCGKINIFERGSSKVTYRDFDSINDCSLPDIEKRCHNSIAQICRQAGNARIWRDTQNCVLTGQLCQTSTGNCCTPTNGFNGANQNCM